LAPEHTGQDSSKGATVSGWPRQRKGIPSHFLLRNNPCPNLHLPHRASLEPFLTRQQHDCRARRDTEQGWLLPPRSQWITSDREGTRHDHTDAAADNSTFTTAKSQRPFHCWWPSTGHHITGRRDLPRPGPSQFWGVPSHFQAHFLASQAAGDPSIAAEVTALCSVSPRALQALLSGGSQKLAGCRMKAALLQAGFPQQAISKCSLLLGVLTCFQCGLILDT